MVVGKLKVCHRIYFICFLCSTVLVGATYGVLFTEQEAAFSNFRLWESLGFVIAYIYTPRIRIRYAHIILLCVLTLSMICYGIIDIKQRRKKKKIEDTQTSANISTDTHIITAF